MIVFSNKVETFKQVDHEVRLAYFDRQKTRLNTRCTKGTELGIIIPRDQSLSCGDILKTDCGKHLRIQGAAELLTVIKASGTDLVKAAYHLGNRHIPVSVLENEICYIKDHVIDSMMEGLGFSVGHTHRIFTLEKGAYHKHH